MKTQTQNLVGGMLVLFAETGKTRRVGRITIEKGFSLIYLILRDLWDPQGTGYTHLPCSRQMGGGCHLRERQLTPWLALQSPGETCLVIRCHGRNPGERLTVSSGGDLKQVTREAVERGAQCARARKVRGG